MHRLEAPEAPMNEVWKKRLIWLWNEWIKSLLIVVLVVGGFRSAIADWNDVPSGSMKPTILEGDRIVVNKLAYDLKVPFTKWRIARWTKPQRGDIVVLFSPADGKRLVKRVVGLRATASLSATTGCSSTGSRWPTPRSPGSRCATSSAPSGPRGCSPKRCSATGSIR